MTFFKRMFPFSLNIYALTIALTMNACQGSKESANLPLTLANDLVTITSATLPPPLPLSARTTTTTTATSTTNTPTSTHTSTPTPTITFTPSPTATRTPIVPKANPEALPLPNPDVIIEKHFLFRRPVGQEGNNYPSSKYRYGMTWDGLLAPHRGVDLANETGTPIVAIGQGTVYYAGDDSTQNFAFVNNFYGNMIILHLNQQWQGHSLFALYAHLSSIDVDIGQTVDSGEKIGAIGESGAAMAPHLHLEIRIDEPDNYLMVRNPELWYAPFPSTGVLAGRILDHHGRFIPGQLVVIRCPDGGRRSVETYWNQRTHPDDIISENFVFSDIPEMVCQVETEIQGVLHSQSVQIIAQEIAFVILRQSG